MTHMKYVASAVLALTLTACSQTPIQSPLTPRSVTLAGVVGGAANAPTFGGKALTVTGAQVTLNGDPASAAAIVPGVVLRAQALDLGSRYTLESADVQRELEGPIEAIAANLGNLTVLGRTMYLDASTIVEQQGGAPLTVADLHIGDHVEIYGVQQADGALLVTRIERQSGEGDDETEIKGVVENLDAVAKTFTLSTSATLSVDYSGASNVPASLSNGLQVEVDGALNGSTLVATRIKIEEDADGPDDGPDDGSDDGPDDDDEAGDVEGVVTAIDAAARTLTVMGFAVSVDGNTSYEQNGSDVDAASFWSAVQLGDAVGVEGLLVTDGILASRIELGAENGDDEPGEDPADDTPATP